MSLPPSIHAKRGKNRSERRGRNDPGLTPSEKVTKARLMRQFIKGFDGPRGASAEYINSEIWCRHPGCRRMVGSHEH